MYLSVLTTIVLHCYGGYRRIHQNLDIFVLHENIYNNNTNEK